MNTNGIRMAAAAVGMLALGTGTARGQTTEANVTWIAENPASPGWEVPANWSEAGTGENKAPANPTPGTIQLRIPGQDVTGVLEADRTVGAISVGDSVDATHRTHTVNLGGHRLITGSLSGPQSANYTLTITNGILQIGSPTVTGTLTLGNTRDGTLKMQPGSVFDGNNLSTVTLGFTGWGNRGRGYLDLRGATVAGGTLAVTNLYLRTGGTGASYLYLDGDTALSSIHVANNLEINNTSGPGLGYIGNPNDSGRLPPNIAFKVGVSPSQRGNITISRISFVGYGNVDGKLVASSGGTFEGWLNEMHIVRYEAGGADGSNRQSGAHIGTFDIGKMNACLIDVNTLRIGTDHYIHPPLPQDNLQATMALCPGVVTANVAVVGSTIGSGWGRLSLSNTLFRVNDSFTLNRTGQVTIRLGAEPKGLDIDGTFVDESAGTIAVHFLAEPAADTTNWAIRVKGDAVATLAAMAGASPSRLTSTGSFTGKKVGILYDGEYTYYAMVDESVPFPPIAVAHAARTYELAPGGTVNISTNDIDNGSSDPGGRPYTLSISSDGVNFSPTLSFNATGNPTVTLKIQAGDDQATATCAVSIVDLHAGTAGVTRTWLGAASTDLMDRREWMWSANWVEGTPPANPTTGTIQFRDSGQSVIGFPEADRTIGGLSLGQSGITVNHTLNLGGTAPARTLTVAGNVTNPGVGSFVVTNGTLRIGTEAAAGNATVGLGTTLRIAPQTTLDARTINSLQVGSTAWNSATAVLDLRGTTLTEGRLTATNLTVNFGSGHGRIALDNQTGLSEIQAIASLVIGDTPGGGGTCYIGNPNDSMRLPPNTSLTVGVDDSLRAVMRILSVNTYGYGGDNARLVASSGGTFTAWLSDLTVMRHQIQTSQRTGNAHYGTLDLSAMDACFIDTHVLRIANDHADPSATDNLRGVVKLPHGSLKAGTAIIGATLGQGYGQLHLSNTLFTVTGALTNRNTGAITIRIGAESTGLAVESASDAALVAEPDSTIQLIFTEPAAQQPHYGLRWDGDHGATLEGWLDASDGRLVVDDAGLGGPKAVVFRLQGATYIGVPPPPGSLILLR